MPLDELSIIDRFFRPLAGEGAFALRDDAGRIVVPPDHELVVTTDMIAEDVHFLARDPPRTIAQKALRVNLSDLAAKGAAPLTYTLSLGLPAGLGETWLAEFAAGLAHDQRAFGIALLGGDTISVRGGPMISITAFGLVPKGRMVHRAGGSPGDALYVSGVIGGAALGLAILKQESGPWERLPDSERQALVLRYRVPEPRTALAPAILDWASAAMDVSDGLIGDCDKLAAASGCSATIDAERVPLAVGGTEDDATDLVGRQLTSGDDYEILAAVPPEAEPRFWAAAAEAGVAVTRIGALAEGPGPVAVLFKGRALPLSRRAYVHGREPAGR